MTSLRIVNLLKNDGLAGTSNIAQAIPSPAYRTNEVHAEVVNVRRSLIGSELAMAANACPHASDLTPHRLANVGATP